MVPIHRNVRMLIAIVLAVTCGTLAVIWPQWRAELHAQVYHQSRFPQSVRDAAQARANTLNEQGRLGSLVVLSCPLLGPSALLCTTIIGGYSAVSLYIAHRNNLIAQDPPDSNFTVIAQPEIPSFPSVTVQDGVTKAESDGWNALFSNLAQEIGFSRALLTSAERAWGAEEAGDAYWESQQMQAAAYFASQLATVLNAQPALRSNLQIALQAAGRPGILITADDIANFQRDVAANGLPVFLTEALTQMGADNATIEQIRNALIAQSPSADAVSFPGMLTDPALISALEEAAQALSQFSGVTPVALDIKPGSVPNSINPQSRGRIPVAILTTDTFDATTVDPTTVHFGRTGTEASPVHWALKDVDKDGDTDMILHFDTQDTGIQCGDASASLTGVTLRGQMIQGSDSVNAVGCK